MPTTRFPNGVTNVDHLATLGECIEPDRTKLHWYFEDFHVFTAGDWTITTTEAGTGNATEAATGNEAGELLITNDNADDDNDFFQKTLYLFSMAAGKRAWFKCRFKVSDATESDVYCGLIGSDTTPLATTDGIWFRKDDGDTNIDFICQKNDTTGKNTKTAIGTLASATYIILGWYYDGVDKVSAYINDAMVATIDASSSYLPDENLYVSFGIQNGAAAAKTMTVDYVFAAKER